MRKMRSVLVSMGLVTAAFMGQLMGCSSDADDCALNATCNRNGTPYADEVAVPPTGCTDSPNVNSEVISDVCAWFVGGVGADDTNPGTQAAPFKSLPAAVNAAKASKARVYLCGIFTEPVDIPAGVSVFGGFDCTTEKWQYDVTKRASITPPAPATEEPLQAVVRITGAGSTRIEDVNIEAASAAFDGGSSIGVLVDKSTVYFARTDVTAGDGHAGAMGTTPTDDIGPANPADPAIAGTDGIICTMGTAPNSGGSSKANPSCNESVGGAGGAGMESSGLPGAAGAPVVAGFGDGGTGASGMTACTSGKAGQSGGNGVNGKGAMGLGSINPATGYVGVDGQAGEKGSVGQGGGGGGAAKGKPGYVGASGGSGGAGGCAGFGGVGGGAGGSSIGIMALGAVLSWDELKIKTGIGGQGGDGGQGQVGGVGGNGGKGGAAVMMTVAGCDGGNGGSGGRGGVGGGGHGGHSLGIAYTATNMPPSAGVTVMLGGAGVGGLGADATGKGEDGVVVTEQLFP